MLDYRLELLLQVLVTCLNAAHTIVTYLFLVVVVSILLRKHSPYSQLYLVGFMTVQLTWNGCPITDFINMFNHIGRYTIENNGFIWDVGGEYGQWYRLAFLIMSILLYYNSFDTWNKVKPQVNFGNLFRRPKFSLIE